MIHLGCYVLYALIFLSSTLPAGFTGTWNLVSVKGKDKANVRMNVSEVDGTLSVETITTDAQGDHSVQSRYVLDGKEHKEVINRSTERVTTAKWAKDSLRIESKIRPIRSGPQDLSSPMASLVIYDDQKWTLSSDGKNLTIVNTLSGIVDGSKVTSVYEKQ